MITYAFSQPVIPLIQAGLVCQTFRGPSIRHARPGERIRLTDRTQFTAIIPDPLCCAVSRCELVWRARRIITIRQDGMPLVDFHRFAKSCGYPSFEELEEDFAALYRPDYLEGFLIEWVPPEAVAEEVAA